MGKVLCGVGLCLLCALAAACSPLAFPLQTAGSSQPDGSCQLTLVGTWPHNAESFTEGLFFHEGMLCESTGLEGSSRFYKDIDMATGVAVREIALPEGTFGEGSVVLDGILYVLTYRNHVAYRYDFATLEPIDVLAYPREGWGLTTDGACLYASDGSSTIYAMDGSLEVQREIHVSEAGLPVEMLNELEFIDGLIWANVFTTDDVVVVDPQTGNVVQRINLMDHLPADAEKHKKTRDDLLNGLAYDADAKTLLVTGKRWPVMFELALG